MDLFEASPEPIQVVADAEGGIRYWPAFASLSDAAAWFDALREAHWESKRRPMYDRVVDVPRLLATYAVEDAPTHLPLGAMRERIEFHAPAPYNGIGMNLYRDGRDSVAMHHDKHHTILPAHPIALVSLGDTRRMTIRPVAGGASIALDLAPGSLLVMSHASQFTHLHGIPKTRRSVGPRMSVVFRVRPGGWKAETY